MRYDIKEKIMHTMTTGDINSVEEVLGYIIFRKLS